MLEKGPMSRDRDRTVRSDEHNSRGIELADRGWLDEAIKEFKKAIELDPESAHAHDNLATVYSEKKLYREALKEYLTALELEPDSATATTTWLPSSPLTGPTWPWTSTSKRSSSTPTTPTRTSTWA